MALDYSNRREFLKHVTVGSLLTPLLGQLCSAESDKPKTKPNILWLIAEDFCPDLGCYGTPVVKSPNIDKLATEGVRYLNAFTTAPICSPSRSAFMTGMYQTTIDAHNHRSHRDKDHPLPEPVKLITDHFRDAGYFTFNSKGTDFTKYGKNDFNFDAWHSGNPFDGSDWRQRKPGQPFFGVVNYYETHRPFVRDPENPVDPEKVKVPPYYPDHPVVKRDWAIYYECIQVLDKKVGEVLQRLEDDGLLDNTIIIFFGDNGRPFPRGKQFLYEGGIHVPLIVRWKGHLQPGTVKDDLISAIDFGPTCMKLVGIEPPEYIQGKVFLGLDAEKREYIFAARDRCDEVVDRIRCVRTKEFKYIKNYFPNIPYMQFHGYREREHPESTLMKILHPKGKLTAEQDRFMADTKPEEEFYNLRSDPDELKNLIDDPSYAEDIKKLRAVLEQWIQQTDDKGRTPEAPEIIENEKKAKQLKHAEKMKERGLDPDIDLDDYLKWWETQLTPTSKLSG